MSGDMSGEFWTGVDNEEGRLGSFIGKPTKSKHFSESIKCHVSTWPCFMTGYRKYICFENQWNQNLEVP